LDQENDLDQEQADWPNILVIKEELRTSFLSIASKLLSSEHLRLHHLSKAEQQMWNSFEKANIYEFLTGEKDCIPEFELNWISPEAPAICLPAEPAVQAPAAQAQLPPAAPAPPDQPPPAAAAPPIPLQPQVPPVDAPPAQEQHKLPVPVSDRVLRDKKPVNYHELNTGIKRKCKSLRRKAQAVVTKHLGPFLQNVRAPPHQGHHYKPSFSHCNCHSNAVLSGRNKATHLDRL
jgi:hypothetical protein